MQVTSIDSSKPGSIAVAVQGKGTLKAQRVVVTVPLGVLQKGAIRFLPSGLAAANKAALGQLGMGLLNKVGWVGPSTVHCVAMFHRGVCSAKIALPSARQAWRGIPPWQEVQQGLGLSPGPLSQFCSSLPASPCSRAVSVPLVCCLSSPAVLALQPSSEGARPLLSFHMQLFLLFDRPWWTEVQTIEVWNRVSGRGSGAWQETYNLWPIAGALLPPSRPCPPQAAGGGACHAAAAAAGSSGSAARKGALFLPAFAQANVCWRAALPQHCTHTSHPPAPTHAATAPCCRPALAGCVQCCRLRGAARKEEQAGSEG